MSLHASGFTQVAWDSAKNEAKETLRGCAKRRQMVPYSDFVAQLQSTTSEPNDHRLAILLDEISTEESRAGRGMLSALVVHKRDDMQPGKEFFELAKRLGHPVRDIEKDSGSEASVRHTRAVDIEAATLSLRRTE